MNFLKTIYFFSVFLLFSLIISAKAFAQAAGTVDVNVTGKNGNDYTYEIMGMVGPIEGSFGTPGDVNTFSNVWSHSFMLGGEKIGLDYGSGAELRKVAYPLGNGQYATYYQFKITKTLNYNTSVEVSVFEDGNFVNGDTLLHQTINFQALRNTYDQSQGGGNPPAQPGTPTPTPTPTPTTQGGNFPPPGGNGGLPSQQGPIANTPSSQGCRDWSGLTTMDQFVGCIAEWGGKANLFIIGAGILGSLFLLPIAGYMYASGNPGNIEKASEVVTSWMWGIILLLIAGFIINIIGTDIYGVL